MGCGKIFDRIQLTEETKSRLMEYLRQQECLPSMYEDMSSKPSATHTIKENPYHLGKFIERYEYKTAACLCKGR
jgi:hypothetical protein